MGFCRRCGDIVVGPRCKCGGSSVAPAVKWNVGDDSSKQDRWTKTYVTKSDAAKPTNNTPVQPTYTGSNTSPTKRFPRPMSSTSPVKSSALSSRVSEHIASATAPRPSSSFLRKSSIDASTLTDSHAAEGILPSPHGSELAKVYGSVLQPKETLASFSCAICSTIFSHDATIYPDPSSVNPSEADGLPTSSGTRFLCRPCFVDNGGSKGKCPLCQRDVLILKSEGGFVETSGQVWHKKCFRCEGCDKNIGDQPMVDLLGRPCCAECFDTCLKRPTKSTDSPGRFATPEKSKPANLGGNRYERTPNNEREGSPALDELQTRLGIARNRESASSSALPGRLNISERGSPFTTPSKEPPNSRYSASGTDTNLGRVSAAADSPARRATQKDSEFGESSAGSASPRRQSRPSLDADTTLRSRSRRSRSRARESMDPTDEPVSNTTPRQQPTEEAIEEMKRRFLSGSPAVTPVKSTTTSSPSTTPRRRSRSRSRPRASLGDAEDRPSTRDSPALRKAMSSTSLRSSLVSQRTGETELGFETDFGTESERGAFALIPDRTGESTQPLRIVRRNRTGNSEYTELGRDLTGATTTGFTSAAEQSAGFSTEDDTFGGYGTVKAQKTGDVALGYNFSVRPQRTGETGVKEIPRQRTGEGRIRPQRTGDKEVRKQTTGIRAGEPESVRAFKPSVASTARAPAVATSKPSLSSSDSFDSILKAGPRTSLDSLGSATAGIRGLALGHKSGSFSTSSVASSGYESSVSSTPDLASDYSDATSSRSSLPATPPSASPPPRALGKALPDARRDITPTRATRAQTFSHLMGIGVAIPEQVAPDARCERCRQPLFGAAFGGRFVTVPEEPSSTGAKPRRYHTACFCCVVCGEVFEEKEGGHAVFVRVQEGACHVQCAPPEKITLRKTPAVVAFKPSRIPIAADHTPSKTDTHTAVFSTSARYERPPPTAPPTTASFPIPQPRFGGSMACPGCQKAVSPMERGVVPGPHGAKWHGACLVCGGREAKSRRREPGKAGCGKQLDSAAKTDAEGGVWCRECLLLLPPALRQVSTVRSPVASMATGSTASPFARVAPQTTGTTLARQFTGLGIGVGSGGSGGADAGLLRQLTGGASSPTRQLTSSPTKLYDGPRPGRVYPRPKSVTGTRSTGGEGRGMFLVRQLTGGNGSFSGNEYGL